MFVFVEQKQAGPITGTLLTASWICFGNFSPVVVEVVVTVDG